MRVAVPLFRGRVSPRCSIAREMLRAEVEGGDCRARETVDLAVTDDEELIELLVELEVDVLVCGGIRREMVEQLAANGIRVLNNVAGEAEEVLDLLCRGRLTPGYGLFSAPPPPLVEALPAGARAVPELPLIDCLACDDRACARGGPCPRPLDPMAVPALGPAERRLYEVGREVAAETDPKLCRIAELVHFGLEMGVRKVGLAFCWELFSEMEILVPVLSRSFAVVPVCCRAGSGAARGNGGTTGCQPALQAALLERAGTELNVIAGLCIGCDLLFTARSHAPVTTLFVRDRALAHNPMGAIHSRYHLEEVHRRLGARPGPA